MTKLFCRKLIAKNRDVVLEEDPHAMGFMRRLVKYRNTGIQWTEEENHHLKSHVKRSSLHAPLLMIIALPSGLSPAFSSCRNAGQAEERK